MEEKINKESKKKELLGFMILLLGIITLSALAFRWHEALVVEKVWVEGNEVITTDEIVKMSGIQFGQKSSAAESWALRLKMMNNAYIKDAIVRHELPDCVSITITERKPIALLQKGELLGIDEDGVILPHVVSAKLANLPVISGFSGMANSAPGMVVGDSTIREALQIIQSASAISASAGQLISELRINDEGEFVLYTVDYGIPVFLGRGYYAEKFALLASFWEEVAHPEVARRLASVDVRFKDQVIVRWNDQTQTGKES